jgi:hypothetical protein
MGKFLLLLLVGFVAYLFWKKMQGSSLLNPRTVPTGLQIKRPLSEAQQALFIRLQNALPSTMIMVQPALSQLISAQQGMHSALEKTLVDFAICRQDSSPLGVVLLDADNADTLEKWITQTGLKCARFKSSSLPDEQKIRDAFGFL